MNVVANPDQTAGSIGSCSSATSIDRIIVTSGSGANPPVICGFNSGQHGEICQPLKHCVCSYRCITSFKYSEINGIFFAVYLETGQQVNAGSIAFNIGSTGGSQTRTWKVQIRR